uniref:Splicing factor cactin central domain-containing protein n=1 Tax=Ananas comosus var. bracteatus TaxID=296719 RepID=A0A6V7NNC2_ANACO|nr:unnamed protein product [Ananas comosus var. bracteatus]
MGWNKYWAGPARSKPIAWVGSCSNTQITKTPSPFSSSTSSSSSSASSSSAVVPKTLIPLPRTPPPWEARELFAEAAEDANPFVGIGGPLRRGSETASDSSSRRRSRRRRRERSRSRQRRSQSSSGDGSGGERSDSGSEEERRRGRRRRSSRDITEEQIVEYMAKKAQKKALKVAKKLKANAVSGYSNDSNPFGDANLTEKLWLDFMASYRLFFSLFSEGGEGMVVMFVWRKKIERDVAQGRPVDISVKSEKKRQRERMAEIEKVKKRREERAIEKAQHEEEMAMLARERARAEFQDWEKKEEEFHFDQSKVRSEIRLREGRTKPIDVLLKNLNFSEDFDIEINEPYMVFKEMEELQDDIKMHLDLDRESPVHVQYWELQPFCIDQALMVICDWELGEARKKDALDRARVRGKNHLLKCLQKKEAYIQALRLM